MSSTAINTELRTRYNTAWVGKPPTEFPNETMTPPNPQALWARFSIQGGEEVQMDIGTVRKIYRTPGVLFIQLFGPLNEGNNAILSKADEVAAVFRSWCGNSVRCGTATVIEKGDDSYGWYQVNVSIPFQVDNVA